MNPRIEGVEPSLIRQVNALKRPGDLDLGLGEPVLRPNPEPFRLAAEWVARHGCPYTHNLGSDELRQAVGTYLGAAASEICITHGSQEALYLAFRTALDPGADEALIVEPCYPAYPKICQMEGIPYRIVGLDPARGFAPDAERVLAAAGPRTRLVALSSPCNPTGRVWPREELAKLAAGLDGARILSDEVYRELCFQNPAASALEVSRSALVAGGLSKSNALTGLRIGWLRAPADLMGAVHRCHQLMTTAASTFSQRVALEVFGAGRVGEHRSHYRQRRFRLLELLGSELALDWVDPEGAFYLMVRIPGQKSSLDVARRLLEEQRVVTVPGIAFGEACEGWLRVSWAGSPEVVAEGLRRVSRFLARAL